MNTSNAVQVETTEAKEGDAADTEPKVRSVTIAADRFLGMVNSVKRAISKDETRAHLNSLLVRVSGERVVCCATNGHWLAKAEGLTGATVLHAFDVQISRVNVEKVVRAVKEELKTHKAYSSLINVELSNAGYVSIRWQEKEVSRVLFTPVDAKFPPYEQVIPRERGPIPKIGVSTEYLGEIAGCIKDMGEKNLGVTLEYGAVNEDSEVSGLSPIVVTRNCPTLGFEWLAVVMPMRI